MSSNDTIAVGYDGSSDAESAVRWTFDHARDRDSEVVVLHAAGLLEHLRTELPRDVVPPRIFELARECGFNPRQLRWFVDDGDACSVLLRAMAPPTNANLLVVGSRDQGNRAGFLLGSTSLEVAQHATIPVVIVPRGYTTSSRTRR